MTLHKPCAIVLPGQELSEKRKVGLALNPHNLKFWFWTIFLSALYLRSYFSTSPASLCQGFNEEMEARISFSIPLQTGTLSTPLTLSYARITKGNL